MNRSYAPTFKAKRGSGPRTKRQVRIRRLIIGAQQGHGRGRKKRSNADLVSDRLPG